jgi:hypothetical protein
MLGVVHFSGYPRLSFWSIHVSIDNDFLSTQSIQKSVDHALACNFMVNGHAYDMGYCLDDDTYLVLSTLMKTIPNSQR